MNDFIKIKGARQHNLKNVGVDIPKNQLVVMTGVSGSGKSSLAFDTIYAEGQRRYVESLSTYARQFLGIMDKPDVDSIEGLSPSISIDQKTVSHNPRSTVGTITEIYDYLRLLFARIGHPHCPKCNREIAKLSIDEITDKIMFKIKETVNEDKIKPHIVKILSPIVRQRKGEYKDLLDNLRIKGYNKVIIDGHDFSTNQEIFVLKNNKHDIDAVIDSISINYHDFKDQVFQGILLSRIRTDIEQSINLSGGLVVFNTDKEKQLFSEKFSCPVCQISLPEMEPRLFSFNSPLGACEKCKGLGIIWVIDSDAEERMLKRKIPKDSEVWDEEIVHYMHQDQCDACLGKRLKPEILGVTIDEKNIMDLCDFSVAKLYEYFEKEIVQKINNYEYSIAKTILREIIIRLNFLNNVGLRYLTISRTAMTLSGGEQQRIRLASQLGTGLTGVLYVLDEPSIGLHPKDVSALIKTIQELKSFGNSLIVVEHDRETMEAADYLIELGPWAGEKGGKIVFNGTLKEMKEQKTLTGQYLSGEKSITLKERSLTENKGQISLLGANEHNLKNIDAFFPLGNLIAVTGVSGSGKSSLVVETLYPVLKYYLDGRFKINIGKLNRIEGYQDINRVNLVDQSPIGRTPRSNPATYVGVFDEIRDLFAETMDAREQGFKKGRFSFNVKGGRCEKCEGAGVIKIEMQFLPTVYVKCDVCQGQRYNQATLEIKYKGKNIYEILKMTVDEASDFFRNHPLIYQKLSFLQKVGLGYIQLGQPAPTFSGGEAQRIKLADELSRRDTGKTLYILDEPTTGLHFYDIQKLMDALYELVAKGNTVVIIEHNLDVIKNCQYIIDLGPDGGDGGGHLMYQGAIRGILKVEKSSTGQYLKRIFKKIK